MTTSAIETSVNQAMLADAQQALNDFQKGLDGKKFKTNQAIIEQRESKAYGKKLAFFFEGFNGMVYIAKGSNDFVAMGFVGRTVKPVFNYLFSSESKMIDFIRTWAQRNLLSAQNKAQRKEEQKALQNEIEKFVKVGDVFVSSWGYEQTNIDYYQVVGIKGKSTLTLREISAEVVESTHYDAGRKVPSKDNFIGEAFDKRANIYKIGNNVNVRVSLNSFSSASLKQPEADGSYKSDYFSSYY